MSTKSVSVGSIQKGSYVMVDGVACRCSDTQTSKAGKHGHSKCRITAVGLIDEKKRVFVAPSHDHIDVPIVDKRSATVLSINGDMANVMDAESYDTFDIKIPDELKGEVQESSEVLYWVILADKVMKQVKG